MQRYFLPCSIKFVQKGNMFCPYFIIYNITQEWLKFSDLMLSPENKCWTPLTIKVFYHQLWQTNNFSSDENETKNNLSHLMTKPTKWLYAQRRLRSAWASAQSDQCSLCAQWVAKDPWFLHADSEDSDQTGRCQGWSESSLGAQSFCWFCRALAHFKQTNGYNSYLGEVKVLPDIY